MSELIKDGGPAFPTLLKNGDVAVAEGGMTLRGYLAAKAMPVLLAVDLDLPLSHQMGRDWVAEQANLMADAMLRSWGVGE